MTTRKIAAVLLSVAAIVVPTLVLFFQFGPDSRIDARGPDAARQLVWLLFAVLAGFVGGLLSGRLLKASGDSSPLRAFMDILAGIIGGQSPRGE